MKDLQEVEKLLGESRMPDVEPISFRKGNWQEILAAQRKRRTTPRVLGLPYWGWTLVSLGLILLAVIVMIFLV